MDKSHYNELVLLSEDIYTAATNRITDYCAKTYGQTAGDTMENQLEDFLFVAEEVSTYLMGNAMALLSPDEQEKEIRTITDNLRRVISYAQKKLGSDHKPS